jgi:hypothetical protein
MCTTSSAIGGPAAMAPLSPFACLRILTDLEQLARERQQIAAILSGAARIIRRCQTDTQRSTASRHAMMRQSPLDQPGGERSRERPCNKSVMANR